MPAGSLARKVPQQLCTSDDGNGLLDIELPSRVDFHRLAQNQEGAKLLVPTAATAALPNGGGPSKDLASVTRRSFPLLDPPWPYLERSAEMQEAGFWRYRWRTEGMAIRYSRLRQGRRKGEEDAGVLDC